MSLQEGSGKKSVCAAIITVTQTDREIKRERGGWDRLIQIYKYYCYICSAVYSNFTEKKSERQSSDTLSFCIYGLLTFPWQPSLVIILEGGHLERRSGRSQPLPAADMTQHNLSHTTNLNGYRLGEGSCLEKNTVNVTGESAAACSPEVLLYSTVNQLCTIHYSLLNSSQWTKHKSGATFYYLYWFLRKRPFLIQSEWLESCFFVTLQPSTLFFISSYVLPRRLPLFGEVVFFIFLKRTFSELLCN